MTLRLAAYKPAAPARVHLLLAALMWSIVGAALLFFGTRWLLAWQLAYVWLLVVAAVLAGLLKARFVLVRTAARTVTRIRTRGDGRCIGGFLSWKSWALVALMMGTGRLLRGGLLPRGVVGFVYAAIGTALLAASLRLWQAWHRYGAESA